jgi:hypothetical protein
LRKNIGYLLAQQFFRDTRILRDTLANFDVANAKLGSEADRGLLLSVINELFHAKDAPVDAIAPVDADSPAEQIGHALHGHIMGKQSPGSVKEEAGVSLDAQKGGAADGGLAAFNNSIKVNVRNQLPTTGIRSWCVIGYATAVLFGCIGGVQYRPLFDFQDQWGYVKTAASDSFDSNAIPAPFAPYKDWRSVVSVAYMMLVLNPFQIFLIFAHLKFWLTLYEWSKWPRWTNYAIFCVLYLFVTCVLYADVMINQNVCNLIFDMMLGEQDQYRIWYQPLAGTTAALIVLYHDTSKPIPEWVNGYYYYFDKKAWVTALLWIFLVVPITIFTYWLWEPRRLQKYRLQFWAYIMHKMRGAKDNEVDGDFQSRRGEVVDE